MTRSRWLASPIILSSCNLHAHSNPLHSRYLFLEGGSARFPKPAMTVFN
jgi:hypothetical protein